ncbi:MAG TPA: CAP domain-containing protein [Thermoanaerobaculia bacterium]
MAEAEVEYFSFELVNRARGQEGSGELSYDDTLSAVAREYSRRMRDGGFFSHVDPQGQSFSDRLRQAGVHVTVAGENLAIVEGSGSPASNAHRAFLDNPGHRANILDGRFTHGGVGVARRGDSYWITQLFARR